MEGSLDELTEGLAEQLRTSLVDPRLIPVRFSRLKKMDQSPAHYFESCQERADETPLAYRLGSGVHAMILDTPVIKYAGIRRGKVWDAFARDHADKTILNEREWYQAQAMSSAVLRRREAMQLLFEGTTVEKQIAWSYCNRSCTSIPDARNDSWVSELKTSQTAKPGLFIREGLRFYYHSQLAFYADAIEHETGRRPSNAYIVVVEKSPPYPVTICRVTDRALELGAKINRLWFEQLLICESANHWPGYSDAIVDFDVPDLDEPIQLEIDGRLVSV